MILRVWAGARKGKNKLMTVLTAKMQLDGEGQVTDSA